MTAYARTIFDALQAARQQGTAFEIAWADATTQHPRPEDWATETVEFMRAHMRAAYNRDQSKRGRCRVERLTEPLSQPPVSGPVRVAGERSPPRCRGKHMPDGKHLERCDDPATRGRFGLMWCERHGAELERIGEGMGVVWDETQGSDMGRRAA